MFFLRFWQTTACKEEACACHSEVVVVPMAGAAVVVDPASVESDRREIAVVVTVIAATVTGVSTVSSNDVCSTAVSNQNLEVRI
jgi:hypothetical protein